MRRSMLLLSSLYILKVGSCQAAARKRSHQCCVSQTPDNTKTIGRMTCHCSSDQLGETFRAAATLVSTVTWQT